MSEITCDAITIGAVVIPLASGLFLGLLLTCISTYIINPEPNMPTSEEMVKRFGAEVRAVDGAINTRLREALRKIAEDHFELAGEEQEIARAALHTEPADD